jgi:hypothetical protein
LKDGEAHAIEPRQSLRRADPKIAVTGLLKRLDRAAGKTIGRHPNLLDVRLPSLKILVPHPMRQGWIRENTKRGQTTYQSTSEARLRPCHAFQFEQVD